MNFSDTHHPIGKTAKQTQNHPDQKGKVDAHKGQKSAAISMNIMKSTQILLVGFIPFLTMKFFSI